MNRDERFKKMISELVSIEDKAEEHKAKIQLLSAKHKRLSERIKREFPDSWKNYCNSINVGINYKLKEVINR